MGSNPEDVHIPEREIRMVLVGRSGVGKSAAGNTILGRRVFYSNPSAFSESQKATTQVAGETLVVVDTPGLFNVFKSEEEVKREVDKCLSLAAPGPHVFLVVIRAGRFTEEEQQTVRIIQTMFGKDSAKYTLVLFTHGDDLEADGDSIDKIISDNYALCHFIHQCEGRYHVFNNRNNDRSQVTELLEKIQKMVQKNGRSCYTREEMNNSFLDNIVATVAGPVAGIGIGAVAGIGIGAVAGVGAFALGGVGAVAGAAVGIWRAYASL